MNKLTVLLALMALDAGGAETHVISLAKQLKKRGINVIVASHGGRLTKNLNEYNIRHYTLPLDRKSPISLVQSVRGLTRIVKDNDVDIIHAHARIPAWISQWVTSFTGCPYITTSHGIYSTRWGMGFLTTWGEKIIAVSDDVREHLIKNFKVKPDKIYVIPNGIDLDKFNPETCSLAVERELGITRHDHRIVYISRLAGARGEIALRLIESLPEIEKDFPRTKLVVVGEGDKFNAINNLANQYNLQAKEKKVLVTGARLDTNVLMNIADVSVGVGRVALESMAMKKPVIIAGEAGFMGVLTPDNFKEAKKHNFSGRGSNRKSNSSNIAKAIKTLLDRPEARIKLGEFGRKQVENEFSIEVMTDKVLEVYHKVLEEEN